MKDQLFETFRESTPKIEIQNLQFFLLIDYIAYLTKFLILRINSKGPESINRENRKVRFLIFGIDSGFDSLGIFPTPIIWT